MIIYIVVILNFVVGFMRLVEGDYGFTIIHSLLILFVIWTDYMVEKEERND